MVSEPTISVVMGVYRGAAQLRETIESVRCQTEAGFEFIIVDDGSNDAQVARILSVYEKQDERIRIIAKSNEGLTKALMAGCAAAKGKYIVRIDNGDVMLPERLAKQRALLDAHPDAVLATCWTEFCGPEWEPLFTVRNAASDSTDRTCWISSFPGDGGNRDRLLGPTHHGSVMFRRDAYRSVGGYRAAFYYGQDWDLWYRLSECGTFAGVQEVLYRCRISPDGISMVNAERQRHIHECSRGAFLARRAGADESRFLEKADSLRPRAMGENVDARRLSDQRLAAGYYFIGEALRRNSDGRCINYLWKAFCLNPLNPKHLVRCLQQWLRCG